MSGHSKWSTIKHKKAKEDSKRGKLFTKLIKEITIVAKAGGGDPAANAKLRHLLEKAKEINMPHENTLRAIKRGTGEIPGMHYERYMYEGYGPGNIAVMIEVLTDNKNRAIGELRALFSRRSCAIGETGTVNWMFEKLGVISVAGAGLTEDSLLEKLLDFEIKDIVSAESNFTIYCDPKALDEIKHFLNANNIKVENADIEWVAQNNVELEADSEEKAYDFLHALEDLDDVQNVYTNMA